MAKLTERVIVPCTLEQKEKWKAVLPQTQYTKLAEFIRELVDTTVDMIEAQDKQIEFRLVDYD